MSQSLPLHKQGTFCVKPFLQSAITSNGTFRVCCECVFGKKTGPEHNFGKLVKPTGEHYTATNSTLDETRNAPILKEIRASMLRGEQHPECKQCWETEKLGLDSLRTYMNREYVGDIEHCKENTQSDGTIDIQEVPLKYFDIRLGNKCNQKCRMCGPGDSSLWLDDWVKMGNKQIDFLGDKYDIKQTGNRFSSLISDWNKEPFVEQLLNNMHNIDRIYMTGGEPTVIKEYWAILQYAIDNDYAKNINLEYNSNMFVIPTNAWDIWSKFKRVRMTMSIDGLQDVQDYIRFPSKWPVIDANIKKFYELTKKHPNISATIAPTITIYNVMQMPDMVKWYTQNNYETFDPVMALHICHGPTFLTVQNYPKAHKHKIVDKYNELFNWCNDNLEQGLAEHIIKKYQGVVDFALEKDIETVVTSKGGWTNKHSFLQHTEKLDGIRSQSLATSIPDLYEAVQDYE